MNLRLVLMVVVAVVLSAPAFAQDDENLAKKLANPVAALISVPIQANYDEDYGVDNEGAVLRINVHPVIPFSISQDWNLISRTILPGLNQDDIPLPGNSEFGLGDTV